MMMAMIIGGTMRPVLILYFEILARKGSRSKRLMTTETWPPFKQVVCATVSD